MPSDGAQTGGIIHSVTVIQAAILRQGLRLVSGIDVRTVVIALFEKTGSVTKLACAMDHSALEVTLGYLRKLERTELTTDDMPSL